MIDSRLKACPFCGGKGELFDENSSHPNYPNKRGWFVMCERLCVWTMTHGTEEAVLRIWNARQPEECTWEYDEFCDAWETSCGEMYQIMNDTPTDNGMKFCTYCGKTLKEKATPERESPSESSPT